VKLFRSSNGTGVASSLGVKLDIAVIKKHLDSRAERDIRLVDTVASTNAALRELARAGAPEGTVVIADAQTAGHGRFAKPWFSPPGVNIYASVLYRPAIAPREVGGFSFVASLAVSDAILAEGLRSTIKWPNDVLVGGKKVAGTLVEFATQDGLVEYVILGLGVNVNVSRTALRGALGTSGFAADSLSEVAGHDLDRNVLTGMILDALDRWVKTYRTGGLDPILNAWRDRDILTGRRVEVRGEGPSWLGRVLGVDREGHLVLREPRGQQRRVVAGEIRLSD
jgi:BirA family transcriptional regulator, biotin operon repressor / biotin---[acetyl-CoA-carboxylase] ligase